MSRVTITTPGSTVAGIQFSSASSQPRPPVGASAAFPDLYNRDVVAFFPFQRTSTSFVAAVYVMTRDLTHRYTGGATPYDLPA